MLEPHLSAENSSIPGIKMIVANCTPGSVRSTNLNQASSRTYPSSNITSCCVLHSNRYGVITVRFGARVGRFGGGVGCGVGTTAIVAAFDGDVFGVAAIMDSPSTV
jgi:hypothetical protein